MTDHAFQPKLVETALTPGGAAVIDVSTTVLPSAPTVAVAFLTTLSLPAIENQAHVVLMTLSSVLQWSFEASNVVGRLSNCITTAIAVGVGDAVLLLRGLACDGGGIELLL